LALTLLRAAGAAWIAIAAVICLIATNVAMPLDFLARPLAVVVVPAVVIGLVCTPLGRLSILAAVVLGITVAIPALWLWAIGLLVLDFIVREVQRRLHRPLMAVGGVATLTVVILLAVSVLRLLSGLPDYLGGQPDRGLSGDPPVYLVLLDGYPRSDSLAELGIDNRSFVEELEQLGFDHYPSATSEHRLTHRTLQAFVAGSSDGIPDSDGTTEERERVRSALEMPAGFVTIDAPVAHVAFRGGAHLSAGGINDFEAHLLGTSILGASPARAWAAEAIGKSLRRHFEGSLGLLVAVKAPGVFAHLLAPHTPFLYAGGVSSCWPECRIFAFSADELEMAVDEWAERMSRHLPAVDDRILEAMDRLLREHPDAVVVLFSDHGARYGNPEEDHKSFLMARTPGNPNLFEQDPQPDAILRMIEEAYP
jgi:hypothetical protein